MTTIKSTTINQNGNNDDDTGTGDVELGLSNGGGITIMNRRNPLMSVAGSAAVIDSLPVALAEPEAIRRESVLISARNVLPIGLPEVRTAVEDVPTSPPSCGTDGSNLRPSLMSVVCYKAARESSLGLTFSSVDGVLKIGGINPNKPMGRTPLRPGDEVIGLANHRHCSRWGSVEAVRFVQNSVGYFSMLFSNPSGDPNLHEAVIFKANPNDTVGISFKEDDQGRLRISTLNQFGLIGKMSALNVGDFVESINRISTLHVDAEMAKTMVRSIPDVVSIVTKRTDAVQLSVRYLDCAVDVESTGADNNNNVEGMEVDATPSEVPVVEFKNFGKGMMEFQLDEEQIEPRFVHVHCDKPTIDTRLGISFDATGGTLKIANINGSGVLWASPLKSGFEVMAIDGRVCTSWTSDEAKEYLKNRHTEITILARNPVGNACYVVAQATKFSPRSKVGLSFRKAGIGPLRLGTINQDSIFAGSVLNEDDDVIRINGIPARSLTTSEAVSIVELATDTVTILARTNSKNGVVLASFAPGQVPAGLITGAVQPLTAQRNSQNSSIGVCVCIIIFAAFFFLLGLCKLLDFWFTEYSKSLLL